MHTRLCHSLDRYSRRRAGWLHSTARIFDAYFYHSSADHRPPLDPKALSAHSRRAHDAATCPPRNSPKLNTYCNRTTRRVCSTT